ncbi:hypothetical protein ACFX19_017281 [Malus domestica]
MYKICEKTTVLRSIEFSANLEILDPIQRLSFNTPKYCSLNPTFEDVERELYVILLLYIFSQKPVQDYTATLATRETLG